MKTSDFDYELPQELIAQTPVEPRDSSRLLVYHRDTGAVEHKIFRDVIDYLNPGDVLVINQTRVIPARLYGVKEGTGAVHYEPMGLYVNPAKSIALDSIPDGATIAIPNDTTNESRALGLLEFNGLIKLDTEAGQTATVLDIAENPHKFDFVEVEAAQVPRTLADVDLGVINSNYALQAGVDVVGTPIAYESTEVAYPNIIAVREGDDREELKTLVEVLQSDEIVNFINETYKGAVVPTK